MRSAVGYFSASEIRLESFIYEYETDDQVRVRGTSKFRKTTPLTTSDQHATHYSSSHTMAFRLHSSMPVSRIAFLMFICHIY